MKSRKKKYNNHNQNSLFILKNYKYLSFEKQLIVCHFFLNQNGRGERNNQKTNKKCESITYYNVIPNNKKKLSIKKNLTIK